ncbi:unnamed protein product, partial [Thelazia callipaeda]|uniref:GLOBIN domain-containing protein n=1 Tax=Thelazia callipaeda TaxID=103827 RepID=A0A0N5D1X0_THECL
VSTSFPDEPCTSNGDSVTKSSSADVCTHRTSKDNTAYSLGAAKRKAKSKSKISSVSQASIYDNDKQALERLDEGNNDLPPLKQQSNVQVVQTLSGRRSSTTLFPLTSAQINLVRSIWRQVYITKGPIVIGSTLLHRIFFKSVKTKQQFVKCIFPQRFPNRDSFNKSHAKAFGEMLDKIIENLENLELMDGTLQAIGALHAEIDGIDISRRMWNLMAEVFIDCTLEWGDKKGRTETARKAWALIIAFVIEKIKAGHANKRRQLAQLRRCPFSSNQTLSTISRMSFETLSQPHVPSVRLQKQLSELSPEND